MVLLTTSDSKPCALAGWLADLIFELKTQRYSFEMERSRGAPGCPGVNVWKAVIYPRS